MIKNCIVYCHISPSGKVYIGISHKTLEQRSGSGSNYYSKYFKNAIKKYGWDNFKHITLIDKLSWEEACECEKYLISKYKTNNPKFGYNLTEGGEGCFGYHHTEISKQKISNHNKGKCVSKDTREKLSIKLKNYYKNNPEILKTNSENMKNKWKEISYRNKVINSHTGYIMSDEQKEKIRKGNLGKTLSENSKKVLSEKVKLQHKKEKSLGIKRKTNSKKVLQYDLNGNFLRDYESASEALKIMNVHLSTMCDCCRGKNKTCKGYIFKYASDRDEAPKERKEKQKENIKNEYKDKNKVVF